MKIYTKTGDEGKTSLFTGKRVFKHNPRIESYGTVDELNSFIGVIKDHAPKGEDLDFLHEIQDRLFSIGSILATEPSKLKDKNGNDRFKLPSISDDDIVVLEEAMDQMNDNLPPMTHLLLPGGHPVVSFSHVARCVCRRAERRVIELHQEEPVDANVIKYLNRLSDYFFVLSRHLGHQEGIAEIEWHPRKQ